MPKLILFNGSSCSGKSTIVKMLLKERDDYFYLSYDSIKWFFSDYEFKKHSDYVHRILLAVVREVVKTKYNIVCDSGLSVKWRQTLISLIKKYKYKVIEINLEADYAVLLKRFDERVKKALASPDRHISNTSRVRFKELYDMFNENKNPRALVFRTDKETPEKIYKKISRMF